MTGAFSGVLLCPVGASADGPTVTVAFRPAATESSITAEVTNTPAGHAVALPTLTLAAGRSGVGLAAYSALFPTVSIGGLSLTPRYGDQRLSLDFQPSALAGLGLSARAVRGLTLTTTGPRMSATLLAGRLIDGPRTATSRFGSVPDLLAFSATVKPRPTLAISPRVVTPLGGHRARKGADLTLGLGMRADLSPHVSIVSDIGRARAHSGRWGQLAAAGVLGRWSRVSFDVNRSRADDGVTLMGSLPFAASDRKLATARVRLLNGATLEGKVSRSDPADRSQRTDSKTTSSVALRVERLARGSLLLHFDRSATRARGAHDLIAEWQDKGRTGATIQFRQRSEGSGASSRQTHRLQIEVPDMALGNRQVALSLRSSVFLSPARPGESRTATRVKARLRANAYIGLTGEAEFDELGSPSLRRLHRVGTGGELTLSRGTAIQLAHVFTPGDRLPAWKRLEVRFSRALSF